MYKKWVDIVIDNDYSNKGGKPEVSDDHSDNRRVIDREDDELNEETEDFFEEEAGGYPVCALREELSGQSANDQTENDDAYTLMVGVRLHGRGRVYHFSPGDLTIRRGDHVIVETAQGIEMGVASDWPQELPKRPVKSPLKPVLRLASNEDLRHYEENKLLEEEAFAVARDKIEAYGLAMSLVEVEYRFDNRKITFFFTAETRIDFRDLVRDLASIFRTRIELRQIGVRDEACMIGGLGICGREFCCSTFLQEFKPVSIRMAKSQNLSITPSKISGACGRLLCCLNYEHEAYVDARKRLPRRNARVFTPDGPGTVEEVNLLAETVKVRLDRDGEQADGVYPVSEVSDCR
ncbi:MAG TPA: stage 0 sporulation family protein [Clostridia bacterium]|nr:stage 0 sporulation family protein [Clostridia bacterium]